MWRERTHLTKGTRRIEYLLSCRRFRPWQNMNIIYTNIIYMIYKIVVCGWYFRVSNSEKCYTCIAFNWYPYIYIYIFDSMLSRHRRRFGAFSICCFVVYITGAGAVVGVNISVAECEWSRGTTVENMVCIFYWWLMTLCSDVTWASRRLKWPASRLFFEQLVRSNIAEYIIVPHH